MSRQRIAVVSVTAAMLTFRFAEAAWIGEDAFITLRVADNFVNGFGLRWNADERVMVYTHPLWMLVTAFAYSITRETLYTTATVGLCFSVATPTTRTGWLERWQREPEAKS